MSETRLRSPRTEWGYNDEDSTEQLDYGQVSIPTAAAPAAPAAPRPPWTGNADEPYRPDAPNSPSIGLNNPGDQLVSSAGYYQQPGTYGIYNQRNALGEGTPSGDPEYNDRQAEFEGATDWDKVREDLKRMAAEAGVEYHESDLEGRKRNAGYDAAHQGASGGYISALDRSMQAARDTYRQRGSNTPVGGGSDSGGGGVQLRAPGGSNSSGGGSGDAWRNEVQNHLRGLFPGGGFNQDVVNRRMDMARSDLHKFGKSQRASSRAQLASRGLLSEGAGHESGPEFRSQRMQDENIADTFANATSGIYANEAEAADRRMMQALQLATGMSENDAQLAVQQFRAETDKTLGLGNLALGNMNGINSYNLGLGQLGLQRDIQLNAGSQQKIDNLINLIEQLTRSGNTLTGGRR